MVSDNNQMVIFGGVGKSQKFQTALYVLDTTRWKWNRPTTKQIQGDAPRPRSYHSATAVSKGSGKDWVVIFGGNDHDTCFNTVHILEVKDGSTTAVGEEAVWSWINPIVSGDVPAPRTGHAATLMEDGKTILVQGGWDPNTDDEDETIFDDCYLLDTSSWTWTKSDKALGSDARVGHRAVQHKDNVYMFGGRLAGGKFSNEFLTL
jgi:N-acetylneuraminic acid mutarotase